MSIQLQSPLFILRDPFNQCAAPPLEHLVPHSSKANPCTWHPCTAISAVHLQMERGAQRCTCIATKIKQADSSLQEALHQPSVNHIDTEFALPLKPGAIAPSAELTLQGRQMKLISIADNVLCTRKHLQALRAQHVYSNIIDLKPGWGHGRSYTQDSVHEHFYPAQAFRLNGKEHTAASYACVVPAKETLLQHKLLVYEPDHADASTLAAPFCCPSKQDLNASQQTCTVNNLSAPLRDMPRQAKFS
mmetsp:Transcript_66531/g.168662  ORF Transcript_66531/g.168662 Transcript_66531/m.168662 type:complete len:246 (-) Transcript_66531:566-1303(-)